MSGNVSLTEKKKFAIQKNGGCIERKISGRVCAGKVRGGVRIRSRFAWLPLPACYTVVV